MKLKDLRKYLEILPPEMDEFDIVNGEVGYIDTNNENDNLTYRIDKPIIALYVDEDTNEICFFHQTQEDVKNTKK